MSMFLVMSFWFGSCGWFQPPPAPNDDLALIQKHLFAQRAGELADLLQLSQAQLAELKAARAALDTLEGEHHGGIVAAKEALDRKAAAVRQSLDSGGGLGEADKEALRRLRMEHHEAHRALHKAKRPIMRSLRGLLDEKQAAVADEFINMHQQDVAPPPPPPGIGPPEHGRHGPGRDRGGLGPLGRRHGHPRRPHGQDMRARHALVNLLLSDAFLAKYH